MGTQQEARQRLAEVRRAKLRALAEVEAAARSLARIQRLLGPDHPDVAQARAGHARLVAALAAIRADERVARADLTALLQAWLGDDPADDVARLGAEHPIVLFPVRVETRFFSEARELRIRVYPDEILAEQHDPALTDSERRAGEMYWNMASVASRELDAWKTLLTGHPPTRAAWIVFATAPNSPIAADVRPNAWSRAAEARLLPDRWVALAYRDGQEIQRAASRAVLEPLALTLSPGATEDDLVEPAEGFTIDADLLWAMDFGRAEEVGMGLRMPLGTIDAVRGFDRLLVVGVKSSMSADESAERLTALLEGHHYSRGLALVRQGTPTNNTGEAPAGYPPPDDPEHSFRIERGDSLAGDGTDGTLLARALGVVPEVMSHIDGADRTEQRAAASMNEALWPVTLGYFLEQVMWPAVSLDHVQETRRHVVEHVRGRGPLPIVRVGGTPYGVLPVSSLERWVPRQPSAGLDSKLPALLRAGRRIWLKSTTQVPRVGRTDDADGDLLGLLGMDASAQEVRIREVTGAAYQQNLFAFFGIDPLTGDDIRRLMVGVLLEAVGLPGVEARLFDMTFASEAPRFRHPLVTSEPLSEEAGLVPNYIRWVRESSIPVLRLAEVPRRDRYDALLYHLLRHAALVEYGRVAVDLEIVHGVSREVDRREAELVGIVPASENRPTIWDRFARPIPEVTGGRPLGDYLLEEPSDAATEPIRRYRASLADLERQPTAELERLLTEALDVCSHRIDAWITSLASKRLVELREAKPRGCHLGAFAWVEDLRPTLAPRVRSGGYIHAPSLGHAAAAAVLRSAHLARSAESAGAFAIDLSSARVRTALRLLDGVRQGQPLGALLGYRFERALHEARLDRFIDGFRLRYPLAADPTADPPGPDDKVAGRGVVDGLALRTAWREDRVPFGDGELPGGGADRHALESALRGLDNVVDAAADVLMAESIYRSVQGNVDGASAALQSLAGEAPAPDPGVTRPHAGGITLTHRVALALGTPSVPAPGWPTTPTPRAAAEPRLDGWIASLLGNPDSVRCRLFRPDPSPEQPDRRGVEIATLADLGLRPIDLLSLARASQGGAGSELDARVLWAKRAVIAEGPNQIEYDADPSWDRSVVRTFPEVLEVAHAISALIGGARALRPADLSLPGQPVTEGEDRVELATRAAGARERLDAAIRSLQRAVEVVSEAPTDAEVDLTELRESLWAGVLFGIEEAVPVSLGGTDGASSQRLTEQGERVIEYLQRRAALAEATAEDPVQVLSAIFGRFLVLPCLHAPAELDRALAYGPTLVGTPHEPRKWFQRAARVRAPLSHFRRLALTAEALGAGHLDFEIAQLPHRGDGRWIALPFRPGEERPGSGMVSLALHRAFTPASGSAWAGVLLDEWVERIPAAQQTTALAVHHDAPGAEAPQAILIAVPPTNATAWDLPTLVDIVQETLDLAKIRAVDGELLGFMSLLLPAVYVAGNASDDTVATDLGSMVMAEPVIVRPG